MAAGALDARLPGPPAPAGPKGFQAHRGRDPAHAPDPDRGVTDSALGGAGEVMTADPAPEMPEPAEGGIAPPQHKAVRSDAFEELFTNEYGRVVAVANPVLGDRGEAPRLGPACAQRPRPS